MAVENQSLIEQMERQLGRQLSASERRLILLAEELMQQKQEHGQQSNAKSAAAE